MHGPKKIKFDLTDCNSRYWADLRGFSLQAQSVRFWRNLWM